MHRTELLLGNGAIARGLLECGVEVVTSYPGTPATEVLEEVIHQRDALGLDVTTEWSVNEKVALDVALAAAMCGKRAATAMKQVGLNVASDSLLSAAYLGVLGGLVIVVCDDPGPHSSQSEQDTRLFALFAKIPVLDPATPAQGREMVAAAFELSERHEIPVIIRPTTRICHARQGIELGGIEDHARPAKFQRDPARWAATPRHRHRLHGLLNQKLDAIREEFEDSPFNPESRGKDSLGIIAAGNAWAVVNDILAEEGLGHSLLGIGTPFPLPIERVMRFVQRHERVLILEEPDFAIETQLPDRRKVEGRLSGHVPRHGELTPEVVAGLLGIDSPPPVEDPSPPPTLCVGCGHRAAFLAIKKALPAALYTGDIGCYTLGVRQEVMDTCLDMGASITLAIGLHHAYKRDGVSKAVVATIGDSTFFHSGMTGLLDAVADDARILVVVLDNEIVAMTGHQPTPATRGASIERIAEGLGVRFVRTVDPYEVDEMVALLKEARAFTKAPGGGPALVVARRPCALKQPPERGIAVRVEASECNRCDYCLRFFGCPALSGQEDGIAVNERHCMECGVCIAACPQGAIQAADEGAQETP